MTQMYISFIDLVGVTDMAKTDEQSYFHCLKVFMRSVENRSSILSGYGKIYFFSDCAYMESDNLINLIKFLGDVRRDLLRQGYFFKGGLAVGKLGAQTFSNKSDVLMGHYFSKDIIKVYGAHEELKGIGVNVYLEEGSLELGDKGDYLVDSCYLQHTNSIRANNFIDIKYQQDEITNENLRIILIKMFETYTKSKRIARYYLRLIISMIQSSDLSNIDDNGEQVKHPPIYDFVVRGLVDTHFGDLSGGEYIYYALLNKLWSDNCKYQDMCDIVLNKMFKKKILKVIEWVPKCIFSVENKKIFLQRLGYQKIMIEKYP
jgi:hypothetical protein